ncbi:hypothetical protein AML91_19685 [Paenibacillus jilunlii]|uniref:Uncharacterized protein n=1 Tax=Paenibacillus jilunlii TaxID=682956 RepID=A0ABR5SRF0_9BACL|nr:hypothetical protein AML91_19685 [Paenibacillus jilunlii]
MGWMTGLDGGTILIELKNFMNHAVTPSGKRFIIDLVWPMEVPMWEKVSLIRLKVAVWDEYAPIRCTKSN